ncbi:UNVERIFIED_CONTAM: hypothetical protein HDU68_000652 [Siphonaria sp. JEL0065]|nr:hypothetical protein HDU68_000652 [Siphonaria sp. JEL0065]
MEVVVGVSIAGLAQYTQETLDFQTPITCVLLLALYGVVAISTFKSLFNPAINDGRYVYIVGLAEFIIGLSMFMISLEMFMPIIINVERPMDALHVSDYVWFSTFVGTTSAVLLSLNPSLNLAKNYSYFKMLQVCIAQIALIQLFPFSWVEMQSYSPYIYGLIALTNNIGILILIKKHREILPKVMNAIGMKMEEEGEVTFVLNKRSISWDEVVAAYIPVLVESEEEI